VRSGALEKGSKGTHGEGGVCKAYDSLMRPHEKGKKGNGSRADNSEIALRALSRRSKAFGHVRDSKKCGRVERACSSFSVSSLARSREATRGRRESVKGARKQSWPASMKHHFPQRSSEKKKRSPINRREGTPREKSLQDIKRVTPGIGHLLCVGSTGVGEDEELAQILANGKKNPQRGVVWGVDLLYQGSPR